ncbi:hypothetical protein SAMN05216327_101582 [Dyadobacter sp. SG02]|uniref:hypothetical protein n=1 Tax=Dyadobacter sp. SG02 TaxID=1855291 RepID=UPI0008C63C55|nr:hypothetical protein [Dyadobacter sp. SG02]SEI43954.1 hypothetical protein SAMN05216327_101582 [Dyadobacter sp. SG02]
MDFKTIKIIAAMILLCSLQASVAFPEPAGPTDNNPLMLNGKAVTTEQFAYVTRGKLTLTAADPVSEKQTLVPFLIYLKRGGKIVDSEAYAHNHAVMYYEVADILKFAQAGDQLVIDPVGSDNKAARKMFTIKNSQIVPQFNWFYVLKPKKDNC